MVYFGLWVLSNQFEHTLTEDCRCCATDALFLLCRQGVTGKSEAARESVKLNTPLFPSAAQRLLPVILSQDILLPSLLIHSSLFTYISWPLAHTKHTNTSPKCDWFDAAAKRETLTLCSSWNSSREKVSILCDMIYLLFITSAPGDSALPQHIISYISRDRRGQVRRCCT